MKGDPHSGARVDGFSFTAGGLETNFSGCLHGTLVEAVSQPFDNSQYLNCPRGLEEHFDQDLSFNLLLPGGGGVGGTKFLDDLNSGGKILFRLGTRTFSRLPLDDNFLKRRRPHRPARLSEHPVRGRPAKRGSGRHLAAGPLARIAAQTRSTEVCGDNCSPPRPGWRGPDFRGGLETSGLGCNAIPALDALDFHLGELSGLHR